MEYGIFFFVKNLPVLRLYVLHSLASVWALCIEKNLHALEKQSPTNHT